MSHLKKASPAAQAVGGLLLPPLAAVVGLLFIACLLISWPAMPFVLYFRRKRELRANKNVALPFGSN